MKFPVCEILTMFTAYNLMKELNKITWKMRRILSNFFLMYAYSIYIFVNEDLQFWKIQI